MKAETFEQLPAGSLAARDYAAQQDRGDAVQFVRDGVAASGRDPADLTYEVQLAKMGPGKIDVVEYFRYRMHEHDATGRRRFVSDRLHWLIHQQCNDAELSAVTESKWTCTRELEEAGLPTIPILAVLNPGQAGRPGARTVSTPAQLDDFLRSATRPLFAKPDELLGSFGAMRLTGFDGEAVEANGVAVPLQDVLDTWLAGVGYVVQPLVENHERIRELARGLATIRTVNFVGPDGHRTSHAIYKIPAGGNVADNFWRKGNLLADVDVETGVIRRVVRGAGPYRELLEAHPDTGRILRGFQVPLWDEVMALNEACMRHFSGLAYQTLDIAVTDDGPVIVEVNAGGSFDLPQVATGQGFWTPETGVFFEAHGVDLGRWKPEDVGLDTYHVVDLAAL